MLRISFSFAAWASFDGRATRTGAAGGVAAGAATAAGGGLPSGCGGCGWSGFGAVGLLLAGSGLVGCGAAGGDWGVGSDCTTALSGCAPPAGAGTDGGLAAVVERAAVAGGTTAAGFAAS